MTYLGIDIKRALGLAQLLRRTADGLSPIEDLVVIAEQESGLATGCLRIFDQIRAELLATALATQAAVTHLLAFQLRAPWATYSSIAGPHEAFVGASATTTVASQPLRAHSEPFGGIGSWTRGERARWDLSGPQTAWDDVHQAASHNSYKVEGGIAALYANGVRTFELDIHRGAPTNIFQNPRGIVEDVADHEGGVPDDWQVYHFSGDHESEYSVLRDGLAAVAALNSSDPITVFIDNKNEFGGTHQPAALDALVLEAFGDDLFGPDDLLARAPGASTLHEAVDRSGWPTAAELESRVIVVLTDRVDLYPRGSATAQVFVSMAPSFVGSATGMKHLPEPDVVVYNVDVTAITPEEIAAVSATGSLLRTYKNSDCPNPAFGLTPPPVNYRAVDVDGDDGHCPSPSPAPVPKPVPTRDTGD